MVGQAVTCSSCGHAAHYGPQGCTHLFEKDYYCMRVSDQISPKRTGWTASAVLAGVVCLIVAVILVLSIVDKGWAAVGSIAIVAGIIVGLNIAFKAADRWDKR